MITIENISGKDYTVVWHDGKRQDLELLKGYMDCIMPNGSLIYSSSRRAFATALPALPRYPKNDEATVRLLHLYRAHGIEVCGVVHNPNWESPPKVELLEAMQTDDCDFVKEITHATFNGERVNIAIEENQNDSTV